MLSKYALLAISIVATPAYAADLSAYKRPDVIPFKGETQYSPQLATLGKMLFFDPRLSGAKNMNCASCHNPSFGFETPVKTAIGAANEPLPRQAPTVLNNAWVKPLFWDGRAATLEKQAFGPITAAKEMNGNLDTIVKELKQVADYNTWFQTVFPGEGISHETILTAIATYERTVVSGWSPFDRWVAGDEAAVGEDVKRGFQIFTGSAGCSACHSGWNFTDNAFHDIGLPDDDIGRGEYEPDNPKAQHAFKTPGLRNSAYRAPYMHDGSISDLEGVIAHYEGGIMDRPSLSDELKPIILTSQEREDIVAFIRSLTADKQETPLPILPN